MLGKKTEFKNKVMEKCSKGGKMYSNGRLKIAKYSEGQEKKYWKTGNSIREGTTSR